MNQLDQSTIDATELMTSFRPFLMITYSLIQVKEEMEILTTLDARKLPEEKEKKLNQLAISLWEYQLLLVSQCFMFD